MSYTKLFSEIIHSTIWVEPQPTKIMWITMLAMSDDRQEIRASIPGLAKAAGVTMKECEAALKCFMSPDKYSRSQDFEGRRIETVDGGWRLLNGEKYREMRSAEDRREYQRKFMAAKRAKEKQNAPRQKQSANNKGLQLKFDNFYSEYPKKRAKEAAKKAFKKINPDEKLFKQMMDALQHQKTWHEWEKDGGQFITNPATWLNGRRWEDEVRTGIKKRLAL